MALCERDHGVQKLRRKQAARLGLVIGVHRVQALERRDPALHGFEGHLEILAERVDRERGAHALGEQEREMFVHTISHDLRSPLTVIQGYAQLLRDTLIREECGEGAGLMCDEVLKGAQRMNRMIEV